MANKKILVVGDLMLDLHWTVKSRLFDEQSVSQAHSGVTPYTRLYPLATDFRVGGAGLTTMALAPLPGLEVHLLSAKVGVQEIAAFQACGLLQPGDDDASEDKAVWHTLDWEAPSTPCTTIKWRMYDPKKTPDVPFFFLRLDQDPPKNTVIATELPESLLQEKSFDGIIIMDFKKGVITEELLAKLAEKYPEAILGVDSKQPQILDYAMNLKTLCKPPIGFVNRDESKRFIQHKVRGAMKSDDLLTDAQNDSEEFRAKTKLKSVMQLVRDKLIQSDSPDWTLAIKLDQEGAIVFESDDQDLRCCDASTKTFSDADSIGAGDFFAAGYIRDCVMGKPSTLESATRSAMLHSYRWINHCRQTFWESEFHKSDGDVIRESPWPSDQPVLEGDEPEFVKIKTPESLIDDGEEI